MSENPTTIGGQPAAVLADQLASAHKLWEEAFGVPAGADVSPQVDFVVRQMQLTQACGSAAADFGELLLKALADRHAAPLPEHVERIIQLPAEQRLQLREAVAHEIVDAIIAQIDQMPPAELPGLAVDVDNPLGEK